MPVSAPIKIIATTTSPAKRPQRLIQFTPQFTAEVPAGRPGFSTSPSFSALPSCSQDLLGASLPSRGAMPPGVPVPQTFGASGWGGAGEQGWGGGGWWWDVSGER